MYTVRSLRKRGIVVMHGLSLIANEETDSTSLTAGQCCFFWLATTIMYHRMILSSSLAHLLIRHTSSCCFPLALFQSSIAVITCFFLDCISISEADLLNVCQYVWRMKACRLPFIAIALLNSCWENAYNSFTSYINWWRKNELCYILFCKSTL